MTFAEEAEQELIRLMVQNRDGAFSRLEKSNKGESMVIKSLDRMKKPTSPKHLSEILNLSSARIAVVLGSLEKKGLIIREMDPNDRRRINVSLTKRGEKMANAEKKQMRDRIVRTFELMGEEDSKKFIELLSEFIGCSQKLGLKEEGDQE